MTSCLMFTKKYSLYPTMNNQCNLPSDCCQRYSLKVAIKDCSTAGSQVVSKLSTGAARRCLTSESDGMRCFHRDMALIEQFTFLTLTDNKTRSSWVNLRTKKKLVLPNFKHNLLPKGRSLSLILGPIVRQWCKKTSYNSSFWNNLYLY